MTYDKDIPDFALQPARDEDENDQFDPSPYDRLLNFYAQEPNAGVPAETENLGEAEKDAEVSGEQTAYTEEDRDENREIIQESTQFQFDPIDFQRELLFGDKTEAEDENLEITEDTVTELFPFESEQPLAYDKKDLATDQQEQEGVKEEAAEQNETYRETETVPQHTEPEQPLGKEVTLIVPAPGTLITDELKMTDIREKPEIRVYVEEDILVPDTKEDLASILSMTGKAKLYDTEIKAVPSTQDGVKVNGEIDLHTLYIPENYQGEHHIINIQSRLPFKTEWNVSAAPQSRLVIKPQIESIDYTVINERKFRAKITVKLSMREYANVEMQVFQGIRDEKLELLKEKIQMTHVSERKTDTMEINEILPLKETQPKPERILKYDLDVVENHKQITEDKAVINATVYCNVLYLGTPTEGVGEEEAGEKSVHSVPQLFQGKMEFTQFIPLSGAAEGSKISFNYNDLSVRIKEPMQESDVENAFSIEGNVETSIEIYKNIEREIVTDIYHRTKDIVCDKAELEAMSLGGSGVTEAAVREIINVPEKYGDVKKVIYIYGNIKSTESYLEQSKNIVEGIVDITLICLPEDEKKTAFTLSKDIGFRGSMEIPMGKSDTKAGSEVAIKELWFDRINTKQIEVNANLFLSSSVYGQDKYEVIQNVCFAYPKEEQGVKPGMVVYITKSGDTLWNIAKKYRTTTEMIKEINELGEEQPLKAGMKLLIVK